MSRTRVLTVGQGAEAEVEGGRIQADHHNGRTGSGSSSSHGEPRN